MNYPDYLEKYLSLEEIKSLDDIDINHDTFMYDGEKISSILDLFYDMGVKNIYNLIKTNPYLFSDTLTSITKRIGKYPNKEELAKLLDEDPHNLVLVGLL